MNLNDYLNEVGEWSYYNFGTQDACRGTTGILEELGELALADFDMDVGGMVDAYGDVQIYLLDTSYRLGVRKLPNLRQIDPSYFPNYQLILANIHELARAVLKRMQGIRGYEVFPYFEYQYCRAAGDFLTVLYGHAHTKGIDAGAAFNAAWGKVKQRNWLSNKEDGSVQKKYPFDPEAQKPEARTRNRGFGSSRPAVDLAQSSNSLEGGVE